MDYIKCNECNSEWKSSITITSCPFCGKNLYVKKDSYDNIDELLQFVFSKYGVGIIKENRFIPFLMDYAPSLKKEICLIKMAVELKVYESLMTVDKNSISEQNAAVSRAVNIMTDKYLLDKVWAEKCISWFSAHLNWNSEHKVIEKFAADVTVKQNYDEISDEKITSVCDKKVYSMSRVYSIGDVVSLGRNPFNENSPIDWTIIDIRNECALVLSNSIIVKANALPFTYIGDLNIHGALSEIYEKSFSSNERDNVIINAQIRGIVDTSNYGHEKIFVLSNNEILEYKITDEIMKRCRRDWWLRTLSKTSTERTYMYVNGNGIIYDDGGNPGDYKGIRPAVWIDLQEMNSLIASLFNYNVCSDSESDNTIKVHSQTECTFDFPQKMFTYSEARDLHDTYCKKMGVSRVKKLQIPNGYTHITSRAFEPFADIEELFIPESVRSIDVQCFNSCKYMKQINVDLSNKHYHIIKGILCKKNVRVDDVLW